MSTICTQPMSHIGCVHDKMADKKKMLASLIAKVKSHL